MTTTRRRALALPALALLPATARAQPRWPERTLRIIVPFPAGTTVDLIARPVASHFARVFGQPCIVDNRVGGGGNVGTEAIARATDGHTIGVSLNGPILTAPAIFPRLGYDPEQDLTPICMLDRIPTALVIPGSLAARDLAGLLDQARRAPGSLSYGSIGVGSSGHLAMEELKRAAAVEIEHVPYRGFPQATVDLLAGRIQAMISPLSSVLGPAREGQLRIIAVTGDARTPLAPEFPTLAEAGLPGVTALAWNGLFGPKGMPAALVQRLAEEAGRAMSDPETRAAMAAGGMETVVDTPASFARFLAAERARWTAVVRRLNVTLDG
jgi:tripartite-type tricarboxylate transporter receptor subunit TctC